MTGPEPAARTLRAARELAARVDAVGVSDVQLMQTLSGTWIAATDRIVVKVHVLGLFGQDVVRLSRRLRLAADPALRDCVLAPSRGEPVALNGDGNGPGGWATVWPRVAPLAPDTVAVPWREAGALLARLHRVAIPGVPRPQPVQGAVDRLRAALARLDDVVGTGRVPVEFAAAVAAVRGAARRLPGACWRPDGGPGRPRTIVHGDWHLGQIGRLPPGDVPAGDGDLGDDGWRLIDIDDLGVGDPVWDLARPAGFWAAGLMPDDDWGAFLHGYRVAGGLALPAAAADPWPALDLAARASVVLAAAGAVRRAALRRGQLEEMDARLVEICERLPGRGSE